MPRLLLRLDHFQINSSVTISHSNPRCCIANLLSKCEIDAIVTVIRNLLEILYRIEMLLATYVVADLDTELKYPVTQEY